MSRTKFAPEPPVTFAPEAPPQDTPAQVIPEVTPAQVIPEVTPAQGKTPEQKLADKMKADAEVKQRDFPVFSNPEDSEIYAIDTIAGLIPAPGDRNETNPAKLAIAPEGATPLIPEGAVFNASGFWGNADYSVVTCVYGSFGYGTPRGVRGAKSIPAGAITIPARVLSQMQAKTRPSTGWDKGPLYGEMVTIATRIKAGQSYHDYVLFLRAMVRCMGDAIATYDNLTGTDPGVIAAQVIPEGATTPDPTAIEIARADAAFGHADVPEMARARRAIYLVSSCDTPWTRVLGFISNSDLQVTSVKPDTAKKRAKKLAAQGVTPEVTPAQDTPAQGPPAQDPGDDDDDDAGDDDDDAGDDE